MKKLLSELENNEDITSLAEKVVNNNVSVRELENMVNSKYKRTVEINRRERSNSKEYKYIDLFLRRKFYYGYRLCFTAYKCCEWSGWLCR